jgi:hypothetical protein
VQRGLSLRCADRRHHGCHIVYCGRLPERGRRTRASDNGGA